MPIDSADAKFARRRRLVSSQARCVGEGTAKLAIIRRAPSYGHSTSFRGHDHAWSAVTAIPTGQLDHVRNQALLVVTPAPDVALRRAVLPQHPASSALGNAEPPTNTVETLAPT